MIINSKNIKESLDGYADICILGGGVAGLVMALELSGKGKKVVVLESGKEEYNESIQSLYKTESKPKIFPETTRSRLRMLGGSSNHWENSTERFDPIDFEKRDWVSESGWPITYDDVAKYYPKAEKYCGIGPESFDLAYWKKEMGFKDIVSDSETIESSIIKMAVPPTRFFAEYKEKLIEAGVSIYTEATVTDLDWDDNSQVVKSVSFNAIPEVTHSMKATVFIMCLGGIENTRLLLIFNEKYNNKMGNQNGLIGRYFMEHPVIRGAHLYPFEDKLPSAYGATFVKGKIIKVRLKLKQETLIKQKLTNLRFILSGESKRILSEGISSAHILMDNLADASIPDEFGKHFTNILSDIDVIADSISRKAFDYKLIPETDEFLGYQILTMIEQTPTYDSKIVLGHEKDRFGMKLVKIDWKLSELDKETSWRALKYLTSDKQLLGYGRIRIQDEMKERVWDDQLGFSQHHMGTTRMSNDIQTGVVDTHCKLNNTLNFYVAGTSIFPTGGHVPPTLTIVAMCLRLADDMKKRLKL